MYTTKNIFVCATCSRCGSSTGTLIHMLWRCPKLYRYWTDILNTLNSVFGVSLQLDLKLCFLGYMEFEFVPPAIQIVVRQCLFHSHKSRAQKWLSSLTPSYSEWLKALNSTLVGEKLTYARRRCVMKFNTLWKPWIDAPGLVLGYVNVDRFPT